MYTIKYNDEAVSYQFDRKFHLRNHWMYFNDGEYWCCYTYLFCSI